MNKNPFHLKDARGVVTIEYAMILILGVIPLLYFTVSAFMIFYAKQSLTLAAAEGARSALRYQNSGQQTTKVEEEARQRMQWLTRLGATATAASTGDACPGCLTVTTRFDQTNKFLLPGTQWMGADGLSSSATILLAGPAEDQEGSDND